MFFIDHGVYTGILMTLSTMAKTRLFTASEMIIRNSTRVPQH